MIIRNHLLTKGFEAFETYKDLQKLLPNRPLIELKKLFENYKREANKDDPFYVLNLILSRCKEKETSMFNDLFANVLKQKAEQTKCDDKKCYREAYIFLASLLEGEMPSVAELSDRAVVIIIMLTKNLNQQAESIPLEKVMEALRARSGDAQQDHRIDELIKKLKQQNKFRHINNFLRPLVITPKASQVIIEQLYHGAPLEEDEREEEGNDQEENVEGDVQLLSDQSETCK